MKMRSKSMPKSEKYSQGKEGAVMKEHNLMTMSPQACQEMCKPTPERPISLHKQMAGCC